MANCGYNFGYPSNYFMMFRFFYFTNGITVSYPYKRICV